MKKCKKIVCAIVIACILAGAAFVALEFMGVIDLNSARKTEEKSETEQDGKKIADEGAGGRPNRARSGESCSGISVEVEKGDHLQQYFYLFQSDLFHY